MNTPILACATVTVLAAVPSREMSPLDIMSYLDDIGHTVKAPACGAVVVDWKWSDVGGEDDDTPILYAEYAVVLGLNRDDFASDADRIGTLYPGEIIARAYESFPEGWINGHATGCQAIKVRTGYVVG